jgi:glycosyltransferase involved in cell wall biosynthesis
MEFFGPVDYGDARGHSFVPVTNPIYGLSQHLSYGRLLNRRNLSVFHMPHYDFPLSYRGPLVVTIHDIIHSLFPEYSTKPFSKLYSSFVINRAVTRASKIIVVSKNTEADLVKHFPKAAGKTVVIYPAVDVTFKPKSDADIERVLKKYELKKGYLLYVGNLRASKNSKRLIEAYRKLRKEDQRVPPLVLVGKNFYKPGELVDSERDSGIISINSADMVDLPALYSSSKLFVFPSLYEGFGLPPLEAMACGAPVLVSRAASLPEVCGDAAEYIEDPKDVVEIAQKMKSLLENDVQRKSLSEKGAEQSKKFTWSNFAQKTWSLYEQVAQETSR